MEPDTPPAKTVIRDETVIWRYMDFPKFFATLCKKGLWFAKATTLRDDPWEVFGKAERLTGRPVGEWQEAPDGRKTRTVSLSEMMARFSQTSAEHIDHSPEHLYVNSWCSGPESMAMWEIYGSHGYGVFVGPRADVFLVETAESIMEKFGLQKPCKKSDLLSPPRRETAPAG